MKELLAREIKPSRRAGVIASLAAAFALLLAGCQTTGPSSQNQAVRADFDKVWDDRTAALRVSLSQPAGSDAFQPQRDRGALDALEAFKTFRASGPALSVAVTWLDSQWREHEKMLSGLGVTDRQLRDIVDARAAVDPSMVPAEARAEFAYQTGAMAELFRIGGDLVTFRKEWISASGEAKAVDTSSSAAKRKADDYQFCLFKWRGNRDFCAHLALG
jgi:hypothetical protein